MLIFCYNKNYLNLINLLTWIRSCWIKRRRYAYFRVEKNYWFLFKQIGL